jgi:dolichol-phosphate mannosyltransferase
MASLGSAMLDLLIFALMTKLILPVSFTESIAVGTVVARVCSSLFNYLLNKNVVFRGKHESGTMLRYYILASVQMLCSLFLVRGISPLLGWDAVLVKFIVDLCLFIISFKIQQKWVFKNRTGGRVIRYQVE